MNDRMTPIPFGKLVEWVFSEYRKDDAVFGIPAVKFYRKMGGSTLNLSGRALENPIGPAAGPHTQLAQNIVAAVSRRCAVFRAENGANAGRRGFAGIEALHPREG